jgi:hypothetical protein
VITHNLHGTKGDKEWEGTSKRHLSSVKNERLNVLSLFRFRNFYEGRQGYDECWKQTGQNPQNEPSNNMADFNLDDPPHWYQLPTAYDEVNRLMSDVIHRCSFPNSAYPLSRLCLRGSIHI